VELDLWLLDDDYEAIHGTAASFRAVVIACDNGSGLNDAFILQLISLEMLHANIVKKSFSPVCWKPTVTKVS
jgi:hypothetical protein